MMLPSKFLLRLGDVTLQWADVSWAYANKLIGWNVPIDIANTRLDAGLTKDALEIQLSQIRKDEDWKVSELVKQLGKRDNIPPYLSKQKLLFLTILWLYENHATNINNFFDNIAGVYADFDYPEEISQFVGYMPPNDGYDPSSHTLEENQKRMLQKCKEYLDKYRLHLFQ